MSVRIFEGPKHANIYAKNRPQVPIHVIQNILNYLGEKIDSNKWNIAVDVGCGSGQGTNQLSDHFKQVYGYDVSESQINEAKKVDHNHNIHFDVCPAETLNNIESNSVQLLTAFEAAHWFDFEKFFKEADRILDNKGVVALIGYFMPELKDPLNPGDERLSQLILDAYNDPLLAPYKNAKVISIEKHYHDFKFPNNYEYVHKDNITSSFEATVEDIIGYIESWSLYQGLVDKDKESADKFINSYKQSLTHILKTCDFSKKQIIWNLNYFIAMGSKTY